MWLNKFPCVYTLAWNGSNFIAFSPIAQNLFFSIWSILFFNRKYLSRFNFSFISLVGRFGKFNLNFIKKFFLSFICFGLTPTWKVLMFLEIIIPFLSIISLRNRENFGLSFSSPITLFLSRDICVIFIENIKIREKKKKNNR